MSLISYKLHNFLTKPFQKSHEGNIKLNKLGRSVIPKGKIINITDQELCQKKKEKKSAYKKTK